MTSQPSILVVEDDKGLRTALERSLRFAGYDVVTAADGSAGLDALAETRFDAVVLDVGLPHVDGMSLCRLLRQRGRTEPIIMLTARTGVPDRIEGLDAGADDYLTKPFSVDELLARIRALLRRPDSTDASSLDESVIQVGGLHIDLARRRVQHGDISIELTKLEFDVLEVLARNEGIVVSRDTLYELVWGYYFETNSRALDVAISYLRSKLETNGRPRIVHTVRGIGYALRTEPM